MITEVSVVREYIANIRRQHKRMLLKLSLDDSKESLLIDHINHIESIIQCIERELYE